MQLNNLHILTFTGFGQQNLSSPLMNNNGMNIGLHQSNIADQPQLSTIQQLQLFHQDQLQVDRDFQEKTNQYIQKLKMNYKKIFGCNPDMYSQMQGIQFDFIEKKLFLIIYLRLF